MTELICPRCEQPVMLVWTPIEQTHIAGCRWCRVFWRERDWRLIRPHVPRMGPLYRARIVYEDACTRMDDGLAGTL